MIIIGFVLCHNNASTLHETFQKIPNCINEFFVSDDNSSDNSEEVCRNSNITYFKNQSLKIGYGSNVKNGLKICFERFNADYAVEIHGDGAQFNPNATYDVIEILSREKVDLFVGSRFLKFKENLKLKYPFSRMLPNIVISNIERILLGIDISDFHNGYRVYSKKFYDEIDINKLSNNYLMSFECILYAKEKKLKIAQVPVLCDYTGNHTSHKLFGKNSAFSYQLETYGLIFKYFLRKFFKHRK